MIEGQNLLGSQLLEDPSLVSLQLAAVCPWRSTLFEVGQVHAMV